MSNCPDMGAALREFSDTFQPPMTPEFWDDLIEEEIKELQEAACNFLKELADCLYVVTGKVIAGGQPTEDQIRRVGAAVMAVSADEFPAAFHEAFRRVHASNMSKLDPETGKPIRRESDGKILKGPAYQPPVLDDLLDPDWQDANA